MESRSSHQTAPEHRAFPPSIAVLIPAWQPGQALIALVHALLQSGCKAILVVDDGSSANCRSVFERVQEMPEVMLLRHARNDGKGRALKTGLSYFLADLHRFSGIVTADADGQHTAEDITRVARMLAEHPETVILGSRQGEAAMPLRSRFGNWLTRYVFRVAAGVTLADTQTGLRGFSRELVPELLTIPGERYEYEMAVLLHCCRSGRTPVEVPIHTIYQDGNESSHFRPIRDSIRIYKVILSYGAHDANKAHDPVPRKVAPEA